jgi:hypothetical protein
LSLATARNVPANQVRLDQQAAPNRVAFAEVPHVGDQVTLKVIDGNSSDPCNHYFTTTGHVRAVSAHAIIVSDDNVPAGGFTSTDYQDIATEFDTTTYPTDVGYFGSPTDLDQNARIIIYYTPRVNTLTAAGTSDTQGYVGGFFFAGDLFNPTGPDACAESNVGEIFYLLAPDPSAQYGNTFTTSDVRQITRGTVAHEFQHMINAGHRFTSGAGFEVTWLDEAMAHFAEGAVGRAATGFGDLQTIALGDIASTSQEDQLAFFLQNFARAYTYLERPDTAGPIASDDKAATSLAVRGAAWSLLRYTADWFSNNNPRSLTKKLAAGPDTGVANLTKQARAPLDTLLAHWLITLYTDHRTIPGLNAKYNYRSYEFRPILAALRVQTGVDPKYPLPIGVLGSGTSSIRADVASTSAAYFVTTDQGAGARTVKVLNHTTGAPAMDPNGRVYVVRLQ